MKIAIPPNNNKLVKFATNIDIIKLVYLLTVIPVGLLISSYHPKIGLINATITKLNIHNIKITEIKTNVLISIVHVFVSGFEENPTLVKTGHVSRAKAALEDIKATVGIK